MSREPKLTPRQNLLEVVNWGNPEYVPLAQEAYSIPGIALLQVVEQPFFGSGIDPFGIPWVVDNFGGIPDTKQPPMMDDIADWEEIVKFPTVDFSGFADAVAAEEASLDRENTLVNFYVPTGPWERLAAFMGFVGASCALIEDPDASRDFCNAIAEYKIGYLEKIIDLYRPDIITIFDDIATANSLFMSPDTYRDVIKPSHKMMFEYIESKDIIPVMHCCGKAEAVAEDFFDIGAKMWQSVQVMNDIEGLQEQFKGRMLLDGCWDTSGKPGMLDCTEEEAVEEVRHIIEDWGKKGGIVIWPLLVNEHGHSGLIPDDRMPAVIEEWKKLRFFD